MLADSPHHRLEREIRSRASSVRRQLNVLFDDMEIRPTVTYYSEISGRFILKEGLSLRRRSPSSFGVEA